MARPALRRGATHSANSCVRRPISGGSDPVKLLLYRNKLVSDVRLPSDGGSEPVRLLPYSHSATSDPSDAHAVPYMAKSVSL